MPKSAEPDPIMDYESPPPGRVAQHSFARWIRDRRLELGLSQAEVARRSTGMGFHLAQTTLAKIENATRNIRLDEAAILAAVVGHEMAFDFNEPEDDDFVNPLQDPLDAIANAEADAERADAEVATADARIMAAIVERDATRERQKLTHDVAERMKATYEKARRINETANRQGEVR